MFYRVKALAYNCRPDKPDPLLAKHLQEPLGGHWGEISAKMMYMFQAWNCRGPAKYRDRMLDIATEEKGHVSVDEPHHVIVSGEARCARIASSSRSHAPQEGDESKSPWLISMADNGPGIPPQHLERTYEAFRRADIHGQVGIGLGLAIASQAAKLLGGKLSFASAVGRGSTSTLSMQE